MFKDVLVCVTDRCASASVSSWWRILPCWSLHWRCIVSVWHHLCVTDTMLQQWLSWRYYIHRHRSSVNFRGGAQNFCLKNVYEKLTKCPNFRWFLPEKIIRIPKFFLIFARKINKIPEFYMIFAQNAWILHNNCPKNIFSRILGAHSPLPPISYAYD